MNTLDRYVLRQVLWPFAMALLVLTFLLTVPTLMQYAEDYFAKGVTVATFLRLVVALVPQALALTIPMSLLLSVLVVFGRLSADREFVAMQACGVGLRRLLRPVGVAALVCTVVTAWVYMVLIPVGNRTFLDVTFTVVAASAEGEVKPRVFFEDFPDVVLYVRDVPPEGGWSGVFLADRRSDGAATIYLARRGRVLINRDRRTVELVLEDGTRHAGDTSDTYQVHQFDRIVLNLNAAAVLPTGGPATGPREMSVGELRARIAAARDDGRDPRYEVFELHKRFSIPAACLVFGLVGLALGVTNRRDGASASFVIGIAVIFAYYVLLWFGESLSRGERVPPWLLAWQPNLVLGIAGVVLLRWRNRMADRPLMTLPVALTRLIRISSPAQVQHLLPFGILDRYVVRWYLRIFGLAAAAMALLFYVSTFLDLSAKVFEGNGTWGGLAAFFVYATPQYLYYIIPLAVLLASLVTVAMLTRSSELVVMKACGISLYRVAAPLVVGAVGAGALLFAIEQTVLGPANRRAREIQGAMRGQAPTSLNRQWVVGRDGAIYHYVFFDASTNRFIGLSVYEFDEAAQRVTRRSFAERAVHLGGETWRLERGWTREFDAGTVPVRSYAPFGQDDRRLEAPAVFSTEAPDPEFMSYTQLRQYTEQLAASGFDVVRQRVALWRKLSFPFVTVVMTLLAVPFAVTIGRSGAMAGIGLAIAVAIVYWTAILFFAAMGAGGVIPPAVAAWAPNLLFGTAALYLLLTVRT